MIEENISQWNNLGVDPFDVIDQDIKNQSANNEVSNTNKIENTNTTKKGKKEKVMKPKKINWFFRTMTLIVLAFVWIAMYLENSWIISMKYWNIIFSDYYSIILILSVIILYRYRWFLSKLFSLILFLLVFGTVFWIQIYNNYTEKSVLENKEIRQNLKNNDSVIQVNLKNIVWDTLVWYTNSNSTIYWTFETKRDYLENVKKNGIEISNEWSRDILNNIESNLKIWLNWDINFDIFSKKLRGNNIIDIKNIYRENVWVNWVIWNTYITLWKKNDWKNNNIKIWSLWWDVKINIPRWKNVGLYVKKLVGSIKLEDFEQIDKRNFESIWNTNSGNSIKIEANLWYWNLEINWID